MMYIETIIGKPKTEMPHYTNDTMELLAKLADYGDRNAQKMLGWHYLNGILVKKDAQKAYHYHCKAANQNDVEANLILGWHYEYGVGTEMCYYKAIEQYEKAARKGNEEASLRLIELYLYGKNIEDDYQAKIDSHLERAFYWVEFVKNSKSPLIQRYLGILYRDHKWDFAAALHYFLLSAKQNDSASLFSVASVLEKIDVDRWISQKNSELIWKIYNEKRLHPISDTTNEFEQLALEFYKQSAEQGELLAATYVALWYEKRKLYDEALKWAKLSAKEGYFTAQRIIARCYPQTKYLGLYLDDAIKSLECIKQKADNEDISETLQECYQISFAMNKELYEFSGTPESLEKLAYCYENGFGVEQDYQKAFELYKSATNGTTWSANISERLGYLCSTDKVKSDLFNDVMYYLDAAEKGNFAAQKWLVSNHSKYQEYLEHVHGVYDDEESISYKEKIRWLKVVAEQGDLDAQVILADIYCNQKEELKWRKMAAEQGDLLAQNRLGYLYESGRIVERDYSEALIWYRKSREIDESQERISYFYEFGLGVDKDERLAYLWGKIAAENENPDAIERLSGLLKYQDM